MEGNDRGGYALATGYGFRIGIKSRKYMERNAKGRYSRQVDTAVYGRVHQLGNSHVKQRRFIGLSASDRAEVSKQLRLRLAQVVNEAKVKV
jgi:phage gpG-like protein